MGSIEKTLPARFRRRIAGREDRVWVVGFSGGLDSTVLLDLCARLREAKPGFDLLAVHLHHGLRRAADGDRAFCRAFCRERGIPFRSAKADVRRLARRSGGGLEEAGRLARHRWFARFAGADGIVLLAHHADDQVETVRMHRLRGAAARGRAGMAEETRLRIGGGWLRILRPLLAVPKESLRAYALARGLRWREDASNRDLRFLRNRVRAEPGASAERRETLRSARAARRKADALETEARALLARSAREVRGGWLLRFPAGRIADEALRLLCLEGFGVALPDRGAYARGRRLFAAKETGAEADLAGRLALRWERDGVLLFRRCPLRRRRTAFLVAPGITRAGGVTVEIRPVASTLAAEERADSASGRIDAEAVRGRLRLRSLQPGDRFRPLGAPGSRKAVDVLKDAGVPRREREAALVLADDEGILWLWPHRLADRAKLTPATKRAWRVRIRH